MDCNGSQMHAFDNGIKTEQNILPFSKSLPEAATLPFLNNFHDPAVFSHVAQMWCHLPSLAETDVLPLKRVITC